MAPLATNGSNEADCEDESEGFKCALLLHSERLLLKESPFYPSNYFSIQVEIQSEEPVVIVRQLSH